MFVPTIGRYEIQRELGRGAMGVVYLAHDPRLNRQVAVKTYALPEGITADLAREFQERFLREARAAASLSHPGIVTIYDAGEDATRKLPYIAMEFVQGHSLKQILDGGQRRDASWVLAMGAVLADALHVAHRAGIVHRDIKPANILIRDSDGAAKIADFGVARLASSELTRSGAAIGSPGYMSPEQVRGGTLDGRSDLFSLAVLLYEALCGKRPFHGDDLVSLAYSIAHDTQVPLSRQLRGCPAGLDRFFDRALSKDPARRFADGAAFREAFLEAGGRKSADLSDQTVPDAVTLLPVPPAGAERAIADRAASPSGAGRSGRARRLVVPIVALALLAAGLATAAYLRLGRSGRPSIDARAEVADVRPAAAGVGGQPPAQAAPISPEKSGLPEQTAEHQRRSVQREVEPVVGPPQIPRSIQLTVPAGAEIHLALDVPVGSSASRPGDPFTAKITDPVVTGDRVALPAGSVVHGHVSDTVPARKGLRQKGGSLALSFDKVVTPYGAGAPMSAALTSIAPKSTRRTAGAIGGGAAGGALLGRLLGKGTKDAAVGALIGGAIGTGIAAGTRGEDVEFPAGSPLTIKLDRALTVSTQP